MERLPNDIVRSIGGRLNERNLRSASRASRSMRDVLGPEADDRERARVLGILERAQQETEPLHVILDGDAYYYSFVLSFSGSTGTLKFGKNKRYNWRPKLKTCTFSIGGRRSMAEARAIATGVLEDVSRGRLDSACERIQSSGEEDSAFVAATVMTYAYDILV
jgi:hypothetical protein